MKAVEIMMEFGEKFISVNADDEGVQSQKPGGKVSLLGISNYVPDA